MDFRKAAQEKRVTLEEYALNDSVEYPAWTFLTREVVEAYGVCPFLADKDLTDDKAATTHRAAWLAARPDHGEVYRQTVHMLTDREVVSSAEQEVTDALSRLKVVVARVMESAGFLNHDSLLDTITSYKQARNRNKKLKAVWSSTLHEFEKIRLSVGLDFTAYFDVLTGKKGARGKGLGADPEIAAAMCRVSESDRRLNALLDKIEIDKDEAETSLYRLIGNNFNTGQEGRYFKKWYSLLPEQKEDRLRSYSEAFVSQLEDVSDRPALSEQLTNWLVAALKEKRLKAGDIQWDTKKGYVESVKRLRYSTESGFFLEVPATPVDQTGPATKRRKRSSATASSNTGTTSVQIDTSRINRLLATQLLSNNSHIPESVCEIVMRSYVRHAPPSHRRIIRSYTQEQYGKMVKLIRQHPMPGGHQN